MRHDSGKTVLLLQFQVIILSAPARSLLLLILLLHSRHRRPQITIAFILNGFYRLLPFDDDAASFFFSSDFVFLSFFFCSDGPFVGFVDSKAKNGCTFTARSCVLLSIMCYRLCKVRTAATVTQAIG